MNPQLDLLIEQGARWVREQRTRHRPDARPLSVETAGMLEPFFGPDIVRDVRFRTVASIANPDFYRALEAAGRPVPMDFSTAHGITFDDTVLLSEQAVAGKGPAMRLLFHEMVHVAQYRALGVDGFARRYVTGWAENGFEYMAIPLERDAYELDARFDADPNSPFSVVEEVSRRLNKVD